MKYNKDPYYLNTELRNKLKNNEEVLNTQFFYLKELLKDDEVKSVYEVGFDFGQRLDFLEKNGFTVNGGVEFNSNFGLYKRHYNLMDRNWDIRFNQLDYWNPIKREVVITSHFLDLFNEEDRLVLFDKMLNSAQKLYLNENCELEGYEQVEEGVYVINGRWDGVKESSEGTGEEQPELPSFEALRNRLKEEEDRFNSGSSTPEGDD